MKRLLATFFVVLLSLTSIANIVFAQEHAPEDFDILEAEVNGVDVTGLGQTVQVDRGDNIDIRLQFKSNIDSDRAEVKAWIGGFEFGDVQDKTEIFTVEQGLIYVKNLNLKIPSDIQLDSDEFTLHIEIFDNDSDAEVTRLFRLGIRKDRHKLDLLDVIFYPGNTIEAGRPLRAVVRIENLGE